MRDALHEYLQSDMEFRNIIYALRPDWFKTFYKNQLLEYAKSNNKIPIGKLWRVFIYYTNKSNKYYDSEVDNQLRILCPDWYKRAEEIKDSSKKNKQLLLDLAKSGVEKPKHTTKLGKLLRNYLSSDKEFSSTIKALRPDWFVVVINPDKKKEELLQMAQDGLPRPKHNTKLGRNLERFFQTDNNFKQKIITLRPSWYRPAETNYKKQKILEYAKSGGPKISQKSNHPLRYTFHSFTCSGKSTYDAELVAQLKVLRPDWYSEKPEKIYCTKVNIRNSNVIGNKQYLLQMAKDGCSLPSETSEMGDAFRRYTRVNSVQYDAEFTKQVMAIRSDWFAQRQKPVI